MSEWQTIDTAPRDGTPILVGTEYRGRFIRYVARWNPRIKLWQRDEVSDQIFPDHMQRWFSHWTTLPHTPDEIELRKAG